VRLYEHLFARPDPGSVEEGVDWRSGLAPNSLEVLNDCFVEPSLGEAKIERALPVRALGLLLA